jgi:hypothetical protein
VKCFQPYIALIWKICASFGEDEDISELVRMGLLQWKIHVEQLVEELSFYLLCDASLLAKVLKAEFGLAK